MTKKLLTTAFLGCLLLPLAAPVLSQDEKPAASPTDGKSFLLDVSEARAKTGRVPNGFAALGLTRDQKERVYGIQEAYAQKLKQMEEEMEALKAEQKAQIENVLSPAQKAAFGKYTEQAGSRRAAK